MISHNERSNKQQSIKDKRALTQAWHSMNGNFDDLMMLEEGVLVGGLLPTQPNPNQPQPLLADLLAFIINTSSFMKGRA